VNLTLRDVIPQRAAKELLGASSHTWMRRNFEADYRIGALTLYLLETVGLDSSVIPGNLPAIPLDSLRTRAQMMDELGYSGPSILKHSDYNGGWIQSVSPYGVSRLWVTTPPRYPEICGGITATGQKCRIRMTGGRRCKLHSSQTTSTST